MTTDDEQDGRAYTVVENAEAQYSVWLADRPLPNGWVMSGFTGTKKACLERIAEVWTDMRPKSLRGAHAQNEG